MKTLVDKFVGGKPKMPEVTPWLDSVREQGLAKFNALGGVPTTKDEDWKYTNLRALASKQFTFTEAVEQDYAALLGEADGHRMVFIGGVFNPKLSKLDNLADGLTFLPMAQAVKQHADEVALHLGTAMPEDENAFAALNMGLFRDGAYVNIAADKNIVASIELVNITQGEQTLALPRNLIRLGKGAKATIIERQLSDADSNGLCNSVSEILLAEKAELDYNLIQLQDQKASHIGGTWVRQAAGSQFASRTITLGGQLVRNELRVLLEGEDAHADCSALFYGRQRQHIDNHTTFIHAAPSCTSRELYKGILDDRARGVFHGRIVVEQDAQLTESEQQNPNLLLSRDAEIDTKPQLEIYADDVKCAHGATVGELDKKQLFYLRSRGLDTVTAKTLLTFAFAAEVIEEIKIAALRESLSTLVAAQMHLNDIQEKAS